MRQFEEDGDHIGPKRKLEQSRGDVEGGNGSSQGAQTAQGAPTSEGANDAPEAAKGDVEKSNAADNPVVPPSALPAPVNDVPPPPLVSNPPAPEPKDIPVTSKGDNLTTQAPEKYYPGPPTTPTDPQILYPTGSRDVIDEPKA